MLGFVTSLRHPGNTGSLRRMDALLQATLRSVCRQTDPDFRAIVVCNSLPAHPVRDARIEYLEVDFAAPAPAGVSSIEYGPRMRDKGAKLIVGALRARERGATHIMFFDSDDYAHRDLSRYCNERPTASGWYSPNGYIHTHGSRWIHPVVGDFHRRCGSSSIVRADLLQIPDGLHEETSLPDVIAMAGEEYLINMIGAHGRRPSTVGAHGEHLDPLPFGSAIWEIGTGENVSGNLIASGPRQILDQTISEEYGLPRPGRLTSTAHLAQTSWRRARRRLGSSAAPRA